MGKKDEKKRYREELQELWIELVRLQKHVIAKGEKVLVVIEGRDAAGKDGAIKVITEHLSPRETRVVALGKPTDRERSIWYFQRWTSYLPAAGEIVLFNRSWYNRAGVERVMGFCNAEELEEFLEDAPRFEKMLVRSEVRVLKYYLDVSKGEQKERLAERRRNPLKQWKISPIDASAQKHWNAYSKARDEMLARTSSAWAPWTVIRADDKKSARLALIRDLLARLEYDGKRKKLLTQRGDVAFRFEAKTTRAHALAR